MTPLTEYDPTYGVYFCKLIIFLSRAQNIFQIYSVINSRFWQKIIRYICKVLINFLIYLKKHLQGSALAYWWLIDLFFLYTVTQGWLVTLCEVFFTKLYFFIVPLVLIRQHTCKGVTWYCLFFLQLALSSKNGSNSFSISCWLDYHSCCVFVLLSSSATLRVHWLPF